MVRRYKRLTYILGDCIEVHEYLDGRYGAPGEKRRKKKKATPEDIRKRNQWNRERKVRHKLRRWFKKDDWFMTFDYEVKKRPADMEEAKEHFRELMKEIRKLYKKYGVTLRWMRNIEVGTRNAWHIHMILPKLPREAGIVEELNLIWKYGAVTPKLLFVKGNFRKLANYITKRPDNEPRLKEASYSASRNMPVEEPDKETFCRWVKNPKPIKGYYIDKEDNPDTEDGIYEGENPVTHCKYRYYTMVKYHRRI